MRCQKCGSRKTLVIDSRELASGDVKRRRQCGGCGRRWSTYESNTTVSVVQLRDLQKRLAWLLTDGEALYRRFAVVLGDEPDDVTTESGRLAG